KERARTRAATAGSGAVVDASVGSRFSRSSGTVHLAGLLRCNCNPPAAAQARGVSLGNALGRAGARRTVSSFGARAATISFGKGPPWRDGGGGEKTNDVRERRITSCPARSDRSRKERGGSSGVRSGRPEGRDAARAGHHHAPAARGRRPLRPPDQALEPEDEA